MTGLDDVVGTNIKFKDDVIGKVLTYDPNTGCTTMCVEDENMEDENIEDFINGETLGVSSRPLMKVGSKIYFDREKQPYTVKALNDRYVICTKPYNFKRTVWYTIIDLEEQIRGTNNLVFNMYDYKSQEGIDECMKDLLSGEVEISHRNRVDLNIIRID